MKLRAGPAISAVAIVVACGPVGTGATSSPVRNLCDESPCVAYKQAGSPPACSSGVFCQTTPNLAGLTAVITMPDSSVYASGQTFIAKYAELPKPRSCPVNTVCLALPGLGEFAGLYSAGHDVAEQVGFELGRNTNDNLRRSLPALPTFRRAWTFVDGAAPIDVDLLGMPLQPIVASPVVNDEPAYPAASATDTADDLAPSIGFDAVLPAGQYEETLAPAWPFDAAFPPVIVQGAAPKPGHLGKRDPADFQNVALGTIGGPPLAPHVVTVTRGGGLSLDGWTLFLRDERTKRPVSSAPRLTNAADVSLFTFAQNAPGGSRDTIRDGVELVLQPPPAGASPLPALVLTALGNRVPPVAPYPLLPFPVTVEGSVLSDDGTSIGAEVVMVSDTIQMLDSDLGPSDLQYVEAFWVDAGRSFSRLLPPGQYRAIVTPALDSGLAKTVTVLDVASPTGPGQRQGGKVLRAARPDLLRGTVVATDGRIIPDAEVEAHPSALLPYVADTQARDQKSWPRLARTRTNAAGEFVLPIDPGGIFDVVVRPASGTNFPWVVQEQVVAASSPLSFQLPVPFVVGGTLTDPGGLAAAEALIQVYIGLPSPLPGEACTSDSDALHPDKAGTCPPTAARCTAGHCVPVVGVEVARARTDAQGRFTLFLDGRAR